MDEDQHERYATIIFRELDRVANDPHMVGIRIQPDLNDIRHMTAYIQGPADSPYEGGTFKVDIQLPETYPFEIPQVRFITRIWHPNICHNTGVVRMDSLTDDSWSSATGFRGTLFKLRFLLTEPDFDHTLHDNIMSRYRTSPASFFANARRYTQKYAMQRDPPPRLSTTTSRERRTRAPRHLDDFVL